MTDAQDIKLAKRLARLVIEGGDSSVAELRPALEKILEGRSGADQKAFLKTFHKAATREFYNDTLTIESAQELPEAVIEQIVTHFSGDAQRTLFIDRKITPNLIAGVRVRLGDTVYDASLSSNLKLLSSRIR